MLSTLKYFIIIPGGMENPCLTFATPTLLSGDKSNADVIAHEIAHSWTGNLVTNANMEHFWLNEGFDVFLHRKIIGRLQGELSRHFEHELREIYPGFSLVKLLHYCSLIGRG